MRTTRAPLILLAALMAAGATPAAAQDTFDPERSRERRQMLVNARDASTSRSIIPVSAITAEAQTDAKEKRVSASVGFGATTPDDRLWTFNLGVTGPLDADASRSAVAQVAELTQLTNATTLTGSIRMSQWKPGVPDRDLRRQVCAQIGRQIVARVVKQAEWDLAAKKIGKEDVDKKRRDAEARYVPSGAWCSVGNLELLPSEQEQLESTFDYGAPVTAGLNAQMGRTDVQYANALTLADTTIKTTPYSVGVVVGREVIGSGWLGVLSFDYVHAPKAGKPVQLCAPVGATTTLACRQTSLEGPSNTERRVIGAEVRKRFASSGAVVGLRGEVDPSRGGIASLQMPLYLIPTSAKNATSAGIVLGFTTEKHVLTITAFIGALASPFAMK